MKEEFKSTNKGVTMMRNYYRLYCIPCGSAGGKEMGQSPPANVNKTFQFPKRQRGMICKFIFSGALMELTPFPPLDPRTWHTAPKGERKERGRCNDHFYFHIYCPLWSSEPALTSAAGYLVLSSSLYRLPRTYPFSPRGGCKSAGFSR